MELGALDRDRLKSLLDRFEAEQSSYAPVNRVLPEALRGVAIAERTLELLPKLSLRAHPRPLDFPERSWSIVGPMRSPATRRRECRRPMTTENVTNQTVKAPPKTGQNAAPGGISRPQLALRGTTWHKGLEH